MPWTGVRNYQARNFMRDGMQVASGAYTDPTQFDPQSPFFDTASKPEAPRWLMVEVQVLRKTRNLMLTCRAWLC